MKSPNTTASTTSSRTYLLGSGFATDLAFWVVYGLTNHLIYSPERFTWQSLIVSATLIISQAITTYVHLHYFLRPRMEKRLSIGHYLLGLFASFIGGFLLLHLLIFAVISPMVGYGLNLEDLLDFAASWMPQMFGSLSMTTALTAGIFIFSRYREQEKRAAALTAEKQKAELAYLRGQLNPHFLFNALNSIYFLIPKQPLAAQEALGGFSDLLRYQLYQSELDLVPLQDEAENLRRFAALNRLRVEEDFSFQLVLPEDVEGKIPPLLLLPLLENAFKHSPALSGAVTGALSVEAGRLHFKLSNRIGRVKVSDPNASGIGLSNIQRRLELLYPGDHHFSQQERAEHYHVHLEIPVA